MNPDEKSVEEVLDRSLPSAPKEQIESACDRVYSRLQADDGKLTPPVGNFAPARTFGWMWVPAMAAVAALLLIGFWVAAQRSIYAVVEIGNGSLAVGQKIKIDEMVSTSDGHGSIRLKDGSHVELSSKTDLMLQRAEDGIRIQLSKGGLIVSAAKQREGHHLYVQTKDLTVSVVGTVFLVNAEEEGSRVAVIEGEVRVQQGRTLEKLLPGEQVVTGPAMPSLPVREEVQWSPNAEAHVALLQQSLATPAAPKRLQFEAASIRRDAPVPVGEPPVNGGSPACMANDGGLGNIRLTPGLGRCIGNNVSLLWLVAVAYDMHNNRASRRISGGPDWLTDLYGHGFYINAVAENPTAVTKEDLRQMLRSMLEDRFKLRVTLGIRESDGYALTAAPGGLKLADATNATSDDPLKQINTKVDEGMRRTITGKATLKEFATYLSTFPPLLAAPTQIKVEKEGTFVFNLSYVVPQQDPQPDGARGGGPIPGVLDSGPAYAPLRQAMLEQLGIELKIGKVSETTLVIDHAENPTEN